jgi:hypothetical protein
MDQKDFSVSLSQAMLWLTVIPKMVPKEKLDVVPMNIGGN